MPQAHRRVGPDLRESIMTSTPSTRRQLDGVATWVFYRSTQSASTRLTFDCAQVGTNVQGCPTLPEQWKLPRRGGRYSRVIERCTGTRTADDGLGPVCAVAARRAARLRRPRRARCRQSLVFSARRRAARRVHRRRCGLMVRRGDGPRAARPALQSRRQGAPR